MKDILSNEMDIQKMDIEKTIKEVTEQIVMNEKLIANLKAETAKLKKVKATLEK